MSACYRSPHPDVMAIWTANEERWHAARQKAIAFAKRYDAEALVQTGNGYRLSALHRTMVPDGGDDLWRYDRNHSGWVPRRKNAAGKAIAAEMAGCSAKLDDLPGLPRYIRDTTQMFSYKGPEMFGDDTHVYARWMHCDHVDVVGTAGEWGYLNQELWQQCTRTEYEATWAAVQAAANAVTHTREATP